MKTKETKIIVENWRKFINKNNRDEEEQLNEGIKEIIGSIALTAAALTPGISNAETPRNIATSLNKAVGLSGNSRVTFQMVKSGDEPEVVAKIGDKQQSLIKGRKNFDNIDNQELAAICNSIIYGFSGTSKMFKAASESEGIADFTKNVSNKILERITSMHDWQVDNYLSELGEENLEKLVERFRTAVEDRNIKDHNNNLDDDPNLNRELGIQGKGGNISGDTIHRKLDGDNTGSDELAKKIALAYIAVNNPQAIPNFVKDMNN